MKVGRLEGDTVWHKIVGKRNKILCTGQQMITVSFQNGLTMYKSIGSIHGQQNITCPECIEMLKVYKMTEDDYRCENKAFVYDREEWLFAPNEN